MKVHVEDKASMQEPHRTAPHMQFGMVMQLLSRRFVLFLLKFWVSNAHLDWDVSKIRTPKFPQDSAKKSQKARTFWSSFRVSGEGLRFFVFFSLKKAPISDLQWPAICWGFLCQHVHGNTYPTGPRAAWFCQSSGCGFSSKIGGGCFSIIVVSLWAWRLVQSFRKDVWKGFTKKCTKISFDDEDLTMSHPFWGPEKTSEQKPPTNWCFFDGSLLSWTKILFPPTQPMACLFSQVEGLEVAFKTRRDGEIAPFFPFPLKMARFKKNAVVFWKDLSDESKNNSDPKILNSPSLLEG